MAWWLGCLIPNPGVLCSKPLGDSKVNSAFHHSKVGKMSARNFWELKCYEVNCLLKVDLALKQLSSIHKTRP